MDLALNNLQRLIYHKTQQTKSNQTSKNLDSGLHKSVVIVDTFWYAVFDETQYCPKEEHSILIQISYLWLLFYFLKLKNDLRSKIKSMWMTLKEMQRAAWSYYKGGLSEGRPPMKNSLEENGRIYILYWRMLILQ